MNPNLTPISFTYKDLLLRKLYYSVVCSVLSQLVLLQVYVFIINFNPFQPTEWVLSVFKKFTSLTTWLFVLPFMTIIFAQSIICAKDYVFKSSYCSTRFQKFISVVSLHNLVLLILNVLVGVNLVWLFLSLGDGQYSNMTYECKGKNVCLNGGTFFLVISGIWSGLYYFIKVYISEKHLSFPVIYQRKFLQLKAQVLPLLKECFGLSLWPTIYFAVLYHYIGESLSKDFSSTFGYFKEDSPVCILIYLHLWMFGAIYYFNMHLMRFFFNLFLTEPIEFPLFKTNQDSLCLQESVNMSNLPIVQSLACLDLRNLAQWSKHRRQVLFTLSQPGGHPHNWNCLAENILKLLNEYTELLNKSMDVTELTKPIVAPIATQNPLRNLERFRNLRNMTLMTDSGVVDFVEVTQESSPIASFPQAAMEKLKQKLQSIFNFIKIVSGVNFLFGDLPQANVQKCLANGHVIIWTSQGLSDLVCASIAEDPYGVVQKDLPAIITSLVRLRQCLDKLNKVPALTKRVVGFDDFNYRMKSAVSAAVKRSLFNICRTFGGYMNEVPLSKEVVTYLQTIYNKV